MSCALASRGACKRHLFASRVAAAHVHGFTTGTPVRAKSASLRVATAIPWHSALAAIRLSTAGSTAPVEAADAHSSPHARATTASIGTSRPAKRSARPSRTQSRSTARRSGSAMRSTPAITSPSVRTLTYRPASFWCRSHSTRPGLGLRLAYSDTTHVSRRYLTAPAPV